MKQPSVAISTAKLQKTPKNDQTFRKFELLRQIRADFLSWLF